MTVITSELSESRVGTQALAWTEVGSGLWVAKQGSDFAGLVEKLWGAGFRATDRYGAVVGEFATLSSAKRHISR